MRRKSPSVKMPTSFPSSSATTAEPDCALVIAMTASITVDSGETTANLSPVRIMSVTFMTRALPIAPAG
jgi:hypothetical protein